MKRTARLLATGLALGMAGTAVAQRIEISSESLGTVVVTPRPISGPGSDAGKGRISNGVDFGLHRRPDGSLYDPLAPRQNAATGRAEPAGVQASATATAGSGVAAGDTDRAQPPGGLPPGGPYGNATAPAVANGGSAAGDGNAAGSGFGAVPAPGLGPGTGTGFSR